MGYWVGMTKKDGSEANFYVEDDNGTKRYYNGKDKRHEYKNEEPYNLIKDHTKKEIRTGDTAIKPEQLPKPVITVKPEVKKENAERFKELKTPAGEKAKELLSSKGLNHASFIRAIGMIVTIKSRRSTKDQYYAIVNELKENDLVRQDGYNLFYK